MVGEIGRSGLVSFDAVVLQFAHADQIPRRDQGDDPTVLAMIECSKHLFVRELEPGEQIQRVLRAEIFPVVTSITSVRVQR